MRVFQNLLDNSIKYGGKDLSEISIQYEESGTHHIVSVQNNGTSISPEDCETIFDTFNRGTGGAKSTKKGTGLGLAIVRGIAKQHNGSAWVTSVQNGKTIFYVSIGKDL